MKVTPEVLQKARFDLITLGIAPYFAKYFLSAKYIKVQNPPPDFTFASDKFGNVYYAEDVPFTQNQVAIALLHEACHFFYKHFSQEMLKNLTTKYGGNAKIMNLAGDLVINQHPEIVKEIKNGMSILHPDTWDPPLPQGKGIEFYYEEIMKQYQQQQQQGQGDQSGNGTQGQGSGSGQQPPEHEHGGIGHGHCGSVANGGIKEAWETGPEKSDAEISSTVKGIAKDILDYESKNKGMGKIPADFVRMAEDVLTPKINWFNALRDAVVTYEGARRGRHLETYNRIKTRYSTTGKYYTPGKVEPQNKVVIIVDTSGSMSKKDLQIALTESVSVTKAISDSVDIISCDTRATDSGKLTSTSKGIRLAGGGGTDMSDALKMSLDKKPYPTTVILLTDGEIPKLDWPEGKKKTNFVVVAINETQRVKDMDIPVPQFSKIIRVSKDDYLDRGKIQEGRER